MDRAAEIPGQEVWYAPRLSGQLPPGMPGYADLTVNMPPFPSTTHVVLPARCSSQNLFLPD